VSLHVVQISGKARVRLIDLGIDEGWAYHYLGDDEFVLTDSQVKKIKAKKIPFTPIDPPPAKRTRKVKAHRNGGL